MSNPLAIAATTATLRRLLIKKLEIPGVTARALAKARRDTDTDDQVNLFLYQTSPNAAWRNMDMPRQLKPGETGHPPLPLSLYYLLTAYSDDTDEVKSQILLGRAMSVLHDHPLLDAADIEGNVPGSDLHEQLERVRITLEPLPLEELSKLWTAFQTPCRTSVAYKVDVVLIESTRPIKAPLPVLTRGDEDRGAAVLTGSQPLLEAARPVAKLPGVRLGEDLSLIGKHLAGGTVQVVFRGPRGTGPFAPKELPKATDEEIVARLPGPDEPVGPDASKLTWPVGFYTAQVIVSRPGEPDLSSNEIPFSLSPKIVVSPLTAPKPDVEVTVTCTPIVSPEQRVALLFGDREVPAPARTVKTDTLKFELKSLDPSEYVARLRVDGVDSIPIDLTAATPKFADDQKVTIS
jgi:uncharacterized protein DUF4255